MFFTHDAVHSATVKVLYFETFDGVRIDIFDFSISNLVVV